MDFEFDPAKSASNLEKHGIDFDALQAIWPDGMRVEIPARTTDEPRWPCMKAEEFDHKFDDGEDVTGDLDLAAVRRPALEQRRVNVDFPSWMVESLDREARRLGVTRQSIIKFWIAERLENARSAA
jgi:Ribonuclease toxin, BrnT, of type II toxin-antitoxin system